MPDTTKNRHLDESGMIENIFLLLITLGALIIVGAFAKTALSAQRYKSGLDLAARNTLRDLVLSAPVNQPQLIAQSELDTTFFEMNLSTNHSTIYVNDSQKRCGEVSVYVDKILYPLWGNKIALHLTARQSEAQDTYTSGLTGSATC